MSEKSIYEQVLEIAELAEQIDFKKRSEIEDDEMKQIKKIVNRPIKNTKSAHEAYLKYYREKKE